MDKGCVWADFLLILFIAVPSESIVIEESSLSCPKEYVLYGTSNCFKVVKSLKTWELARKACEEDNGDLVVIPDKETMDFIQGLLEGSSRYWVGLRGVKWINGVARNKQPPVYGSGECAAMTRMYYKWQYYPCPTLSRRYICEKVLYPVIALTSIEHWTATPTDKTTTNGIPTNTLINKGTLTNTPIPNGAPTNTPTANGTHTNTSTDHVTLNSTHTTVSVNVSDPVPGHELRPITLQGETYQKSSQPQNYSDIPNLCQRYNLTEYIIQSNEQFWWFQNIISAPYALYENFRIWIKTKKLIYWDLNYWGNNELVDPNAWAIGVHSTTPCFKGHISDCCVVLTWDPVKNGTYLLDAPCTDTLYGLCVEENNVTGITMVPLPTIELVMTVETVSLLKNLTAPKNGSVAKNLCPCRCRNDKIDFNPSPAALLSILNKIQKELRVDTKQLASRRNKKVSAQDKRTSSQTIGFIGIALCAVPLGIIIFFDILRLFHVQT